MTDAAWVSFLDSLESELHALRLRPDGKIGSADFTPPEGLGPLPQACARRARELLGQIETISEAVHEDMRRTTRQLAEQRALDPRGPRPASSFDSKA